jgi:valyl-tRNA synthetase
VKKEKREKVSAPTTVVASTEKKEKKEKKAKEGKEAETVCEDHTPEGQCKDIAAVFPAAYQPRYVEAAWQSWWEKSKFYEPDVEKGSWVAVVVVVVVVIVVIIVVVCCDKFIHAMKTWS